MMVECVILARSLQAFSPSNRHLIGTAFAGYRKNNSARAFFSTTPGDHKSSLKDIKNEVGTIKFSTSKANNSVWSVEKTLGSAYQKPWWKVLPFSLAGIAFLVWCFFRKETEIDRKLEQSLNDHLPGAEPKEDAKQPNKET